MNYTIGQLSKANYDDSEFRTSKTLVKSSITSKFFNKEFKDYALSINNEKFTVGNTYYYKCSSLKPSKQFKSGETILEPGVTVLVKLVKDNNVQLIKELSIPNNGTSVEFSFSPLGEFDKLVFEIQRTINDIADTSTLDNKRTIKINEGATENLYLMKNIIGGNVVYKRIGIQSNVGSIFIVNNEEIKIGKTGIFEFKNNDIPINYFSCIKANGFILDYIEMSSGGEV